MRHSHRQAAGLEQLDHLDGVLRPATILDLAPEQEVELPTLDPEALAEYLSSASHRGTLADYLRAFDVTVPVTLTPA